MREEEYRLPRGSGPNPRNLCDLIWKEGLCRGDSTKEFEVILDYLGGSPPENAAVTILTGEGPRKSQRTLRKRWEQRDQPRGPEPRDAGNHRKSEETGNGFPSRAPQAANHLDLGLRGAWTSGFHNCENTLLLF